MVPIAVAIALLILINALSEFVYTRFDLIEDHRYTLSEAAIAAVSKFERPVIVDVLLERNLSPKFVKPRTSTEP